MTWPPKDHRLVKVPYERARGDLGRVYIGISRDTRTPPTEWKAAGGDTDHSRCRHERGKCRAERVVTWWFPNELHGVAWLKDRDGERATRVSV